VKRVNLFIHRRGLPEPPALKPKGWEERVKRERELGCEKI
jgi:hypothetical protein